MEIKLTSELVNEILQYLGTKPFIEVSKLINEILKQANSQAPQTSEEN